jgi:GNAT superfamily N-acetyltransferase
LSGAKTRLATEDDIEAVAALFDGYRQFYGRTPDLVGATGFIGERVIRGDSVVIVAEGEDGLVGFAQLYPSFTSVGMDRIMILNDLFVSSKHRGGGVGRALLDAAVHWAKRVGAIRLTLSTQKENLAAQQVYEKAGWTRDEAFYTYKLELAD